jgi:hypothetical protein
MIDCLIKCGCVAAALTLLGCDGKAPDRAGEKKAAGGGVTIVLPEARVERSAPASLEQVSDQSKEAPAAASEIPAAAPERAKEDDAPPPKEVEPSEPEESDTGETPPEAPPAPRASKPPLPDAVIARTIERIGYPCGAVSGSALVSAGEGERVYRISCTSGRSYRASDRTGRFRFKEWSGAE